jgi:neutral ceramidase
MKKLMGELEVKRKGYWRGTLRVGAAKADITPPASMFPFTSNAPVGQLARPDFIHTTRARSFIGAHDPIYVRALVLDNGAVQAAVLTYDLSGIAFADEFSKKISDAIGIPTELIFMAATHDHSTGWPEEAGDAGRPQEYSVQGHC